MSASACSVVEIGDLQPEEQELRVQRGALLGQAGDERAAGGSAMSVENRRCASRWRG